MILIEAVEAFLLDAINKPGSCWSHAKVRLNRRPILLTFIA